MTEPTPEQVAMMTGHLKPRSQWLLDDRDVWVLNPYYVGPETPHPEDDDPDFAYYEALAVAWDARQEGRVELAEEVMRPWDRPAEAMQNNLPDDLPF